MNVFDLRDRLVGDYARYTSSFIKIADTRISTMKEKKKLTLERRKNYNLYGRNINQNNDPGQE